MGTSMVFAQFDDPAVIIESYVARTVPRDKEIGVLYGLDSVVPSDEFLWRVIEGLRMDSLPIAMIHPNSRIMISSQSDILKSVMISQHNWRLGLWQAQGDYQVIPARVITGKEWIVIELLFTRDKQQLVGILLPEDR
ncbi:hypothetical protein PVA45_03905 [Entomospira entomophila]|uniref:Uncharacterized protein n=1 Tax=Entomospira entomophila TaxID=2719988 RepID=A0A968G8S4_9SPIO|nr:hypothetical protein [Entomospira entomophilus]NIZ40655.1 hypothetical protein [Entomospira entomophilus]WDI34869.1 hypothetical protein PVA45_03905 [Entomospira entomophilus]